jgi:hypothetical protein
VTTIEKVAMGIVGVALVTTLILPDRQTAKVLTAGGNVFSQALKTAMGR